MRAAAAAAAAVAAAMNTVAANQLQRLTTTPVCIIQSQETIRLSGIDGVPV